MYSFLTRFRSTHSRWPPESCGSSIGALFKHGRGAHALLAPYEALNFTEWQTRLRLIRRELPMGFIPKPAAVRMVPSLTPPGSNRDA